MKQNDRCFRVKALGSRLNEDLDEDMQLTCQTQQCSFLPQSMARQGRPRSTPFLTDMEGEHWSVALVCLLGGKAADDVPHKHGFCFVLVRNARVLVRMLFVLDICMRPEAWYVLGGAVAKLTSAQTTRELKKATGKS